jgi:hypothetical protein
MADTASKRPKRRWHQYSLRTLFLLTLLAAIGGSWWASRRKAERRTVAAVEHLIAQGARVDVILDQYTGVRLTLDDGPSTSWIPESPLCCRGRLLVMFIEDWRGTASDLRRLIDLDNLYILEFRSSRIAAGDLDFLDRLQSLESLSISCRDIDARLLAQIGRLEQLDSLGLRGPVTDTVLAALAPARRLESIVLYDSQVTVSGVRQFASDHPALKYLDHLPNFRDQSNVSDMQHNLRGDLWMGHTLASPPTAAIVADALKSVEAHYDVPVRVELPHEGFLDRRVEASAVENLRSLLAALDKMDVEMVALPDSLVITSRAKAEALAPEAPVITYEAEKGRFCVLRIQYRAKTEAD